jgi:glycyl-tRNA synthetase beta chain
MPDLLIELFSEEIPARMQAKAASDLKRLVTDGLVEAGLTYTSAGAFSTPRRLVLSVEEVTAESRAVREERKGPRTDAPAAALEGFLRSTGLTRDQLEVRDDKKAQVYFAVVEKPGRAADAIVAEVLEGAIRNFPWPKSMRWGSGSLRWVRPLQSILCLLVDEVGARVVPLEVDGIVAGNTTEGHRFMGAGRFAVSSFEDYRLKLGRAKVMLDAAEREAQIWQDATNMAFAAGLEVMEDRGLLAEVAGLVEWPSVLMGQIGEEFMGLPAEVLQTSMKEHQKFFSVRNPKTGRIERFITVANIEAADGGAAILRGNQKVLRARLSDARFFWENDLRVAKGGMGEWADGLRAVTFHNKLGSQAERIDRIAALAREIAPMVGADAALAEQAARVAKLDLRSSMVGEFPELQGVMGRYYALEAGMPAAVADAARDHYSPLGPSDAVPTEPVSVAVALADKIDTLTGFWAIDEKPTGSKDPFALRRAALGVIRILIQQPKRVYIEGVLWEAFRQHKVVDQPEGSEAVDLSQALNSIYGFFNDRLKVLMRDQGLRHDIVEAAMAVHGAGDYQSPVERAEALQSLLATDYGTNLLQGFKRANNILSQAEAKDGVEYSFGADPKFAETDAERALFNALDVAEQAIGHAMKGEDFAAAMGAMAQLRAPIDAFFDAVQINAENEILRRNRLNLLHRIRAICSGVADLTKVDG